MRTNGKSYYKERVGTMTVEGAIAIARDIAIIAFVILAVLGELNLT